MAEVLVSQVSKVYLGGVQALTDLNLQVADGELLVLVGPSGCGKTTALRIIAGLETPTGGSVVIGGRDVTRLPPRERNVAMVFQDHVVYPHLSVRRNLSFGLEMRKPLGWLRRLWPRRDPRMDEEVTRAARLLELQDVLERRADRLSGGQQQRVALGRAIVRRPDVFLLDEPLSQLDVRLRMEMRRQLHLLQRRLNATMIYVTHDPVEATSLGDRVVVLDQGTVQQAGPPRELYERPVNRTVAALIGWPPMSFLDGELARTESGLALVGGECAIRLSDEASWQGFSGRPLTLGVRPEEVRLGEAAAAGESGVNSLTMQVELVESLGSIRLVTLQRGSWRITARLEGDRQVSERERLEVMLNPRKTYWFDRSSGLAHAGGMPAG